MRFLKMVLFSICFLLSEKASAAEKYFQGYRFYASVLTGGYFDDPYLEYRYGNVNAIRVKEGNEYSISVNNPLPVRVAAAVTVDGLNTIDGKRTSAADAQKWIIEPYSTITISGWQTSDTNLRKFVFTKEGASYASWKGQRDKKDYSTNLGLIGVAYFWSSDELSRALHPPKAVVSEYEERSDSLSESAGVSIPGSPQKEKRAGTGMGRTEWSQVTRVHFHYDAGMYSASDALTIRYEFELPVPQPKPFEDEPWHYRYRNNYTPQMP